MTKKVKSGIEFGGATVDEAIQNAIKELKVSREYFDVIVVCEEKRGLFGMEGEKPAKIKVFLKKNNSSS